MSASRARIEEADDPDDFELPSLPAMHQKSMGQSSRLPQRAGQTGDEVKSWTILYPIYLDAKRPKKTGQRRVGKEHAVEWPLAKQMAIAATSLGFKVHLENLKRHPADWENPGRIRVMLKNSKGKTVNARIPNRSVLLKKLAELHPKTPSTAHISQRLPPNSPAISHGVLQNVIDDPSQLPLPPGMENLPTPAATPAIEAEKEKKAEPSKKKGKQKVKIIRR